MRNQLLTQLLSCGVQTIGENNGKYTFYTEVSNTHKFICPPLFDASISVGSVIIVKVARVVGNSSNFELSVLVCCNASSSLGLATNDNEKRNNLMWRELTNADLKIHPSEISK